VRGGRPASLRAGELLQFAVTQVYRDYPEGGKEGFTLLKHQPLAVAAPAKKPRSRVSQVIKRTRLLTVEVQEPQLTFAILAAHEREMPPVRRPGRLALPGAALEKAPGSSAVKRLLPEITRGHEGEAAAVR